MQTEAPVSFGWWIRRRRRALDMTQEELAARASCSVSAIRKIENDERRPSRQVAELLADALAIAADERPTFLSVARQELRFERLGEATASVPTPPLPSPIPPARSSLAANAPPLPWPPAPSPLVPSPSAAEEEHHLGGVHLPLPALPMVGRAPELSQISHLLNDPTCRLLTLVGPGGIGKTRLALAAAHAVSAHFRNGVFFIPLAALSAADLLTPTIANQLGCRLLSGDSQLQLVQYLQDKELLLVLDNLEHLLDDVDILAAILWQTPRVKLLATSREVLGLQGEWVFAVQGLPVPPERAQRLETYSSAALFLQSAQRARANFTLTEQEWPDVTRICRLVGGLPLAIELAAGWVNMLTCAEIADEIQRDLGILSTRMRDLPERHRSITAVFDHSWRLLNPEEKAVMHRLSVFRGGFTREIAAQVTGASLVMLSSLVERSLVTRLPNSRYDLHELVRQYCAEQLQQEGATEATRRAHADACATLVAEAVPHLIGAGQPQWLDRIEAEIGNLRAAMEWAATNHVYTLGLAIAAPLLGFWYQRDHHSEGRSWIEYFLEMAGTQLSQPARAHALTQAAYLAYEQGDLSVARSYLDDALSLLSAYPELQTSARAYAVLGQVLASLGDYTAAREAFERRLTLPYDLDPGSRSHAIAFMGLGDIASLEGDWTLAGELYRRSTELFRQHTDLNATAYVLRKWAWALFHTGDVAQAIPFCQESLRLNQQTASLSGQLACVACMGALWLESGHPETGVELLAATTALLTANQAQLRPTDRFEFDQVLANARRQLTPERFAAAWSRGHQLTLELANKKALTGGQP